MSMARNCAGSAFVFALGFAIEAAGACVLPSFEPVMLRLAGRDALLADGRSVRLTGLTPLPAAFTFPDGPARLSVLTGVPDRWGRVTGVLAPREGGWAESFNLALLRAGTAFLVPGEWPTSCREAARLAEREARTARRGVWSTDPVLRATDLEGLRAREGRFALVAGTIRSVRQGRRQVFLNFGTFESDRFSATVAVSRLDAFKAAGLDLLALRGHAVELRGVVGAGPSMEIQAAEALAVLGRP